MPKQPPITKRLNNLEDAFCKTLEAQMRENRAVRRQIRKMQNRLDKIERRSEGKSCIGFIEDDTE